MFYKQFHSSTKWCIFQEDVFQMYTTLRLPRSMSRLFCYWRNPTWLSFAYDCGNWLEFNLWSLSVSRSLVHFLCLEKTWIITMMWRTYLLKWEPIFKYRSVLYAGLRFINPVLCNLEYMTSNSETIVLVWSSHHFPFHFFEH